MAIWVLDLDGVVWRGQTLIANSDKAIAKLQGDGHRVLYVTNNSALTAQGYVDKLQGLGIAADVNQIVHAGHALARLVASRQWKGNSKVLVCGGDGITEALRAIDVEVINTREVTRLSDCDNATGAVVGWRPDVSYQDLNLILQAVVNGAELLGPSRDPQYPSDDGVKLGGGSLIAAVSYAANVTATIAGKPMQPMADALLARAEELQSHISYVVGDQRLSDGALAQRLGVSFMLVRSGVNRSDVNDDKVPVAIDAQDLWSGVKEVTGE